MHTDAATDLDVLALFDGLDDLVFVVGLDRRIRAVNACVPATLAYEAEALVGRDVVTLHPPSVRAEAERVFAEFAGGARRRHGLPVVAADGRLVELEVHAIPFRWHGEPALLGVARDITERLRRERAERSRLVMQRLLDQLADVVHGGFPADAAETIRRLLAVVGELSGADHAWCARDHDVAPLVADEPDVWCWSREGVAPVPPSAFRCERLPWAAATLARDGRLDVADIGTLPSEAATEHAVWQSHGLDALVAFPLRGVAALRGCWGIARAAGDDAPLLRSAADTTLLSLVGELLAQFVERVRVVAALESSEARYRDLAASLGREVETRAERIRELERVQVELDKLAAMGRIAARVAHEINNPLAGVVNAVELVADAVPSDDPRRRFLDMIRRETARMADIVRQLFDLYRPIPATGQRFDVADTVREIVELLAANWRPKRLHVTAPAGVRVESRVAEPLVRQVLVALLQNAIEASAEAGHIDVETWHADGQLHLRVRDDGPGVPAALREHVFAPFVTTKVGHPRAGLGLGLASARDIATSLGGTLRCEAVPQGASFLLSVPEREPDARTS